MTATAGMPNHDRPEAGPLLIVGIVLATLTEAIASTVLSLGRGDIIGDTYATPDELAWLDVGYTALKLIGFLLSPWLMAHINPRNLIIGSTLLMGVACGMAAITARLDLLSRSAAYRVSPAAPCLSEGRCSFFSPIPKPASRPFRLYSRWAPSSRPRRSLRPFKDGCSTAMPGHGSSLAAFR